VALAQQAVQLSGGNAPEILDTLAAAYAEDGNFPEAVATAQRAVDLSAAQNKKNLAEIIQNQLKLLKSMPHSMRNHSQLTNSLAKSHSR